MGVQQPQRWIMILQLMKTAILGTLAIVMMALPSAAQTVSSQDPASIAKLLRDRNQTVIITVDEFGDPFIETSFDNIDYNVLFYGCTAHEMCNSVSLRAQRFGVGSASYEAVNRWNTDQRWTKLYTESANSATLEMDLLFLDGPISVEAFASHMNVWERSLLEFARYIDGGSYEFVD